MSSHPTTSVNPDHGPGLSCSVVIGFVLSGAIFFLAYAIGNFVILRMGPTKFSSIGLEPEALPFVLLVSALLGMIGTVLFFPPSKINSWFYSGNSKTGSMPRYGLMTYSLSCTGSLAIGFLLTAAFALVVIPLVITSIRDIQGLITAFLLAGPIEVIGLILFTLFSIGFILTPTRANWLIRWYFKDFWDSKP